MHGLKDLSIGGGFVGHQDKWNNQACLVTEELAKLDLCKTALALERPRFDRAWCPQGPGESVYRIGDSHGSEQHPGE